MRKTHWYHIGLAFVNPWIIHACQLTYHWQPLNLPNPSPPLNKQFFDLSASSALKKTSLLDVDLDGCHHGYMWSTQPIKRALSHGLHTPIPEWHGLLNPTSEAINGKLPMGPIPQDEGTALYNEIHANNVCRNDQTNWGTSWSPTFNII